MKELREYFPIAYLYISRLIKILVWNVEVLFLCKSGLLTFILHKMGTIAWDTEVNKNALVRKEFLAGRHGG